MATMLLRSVPKFSAHVMTRTADVTFQTVNKNLANYFGSSLCGLIPSTTSSSSSAQIARSFFTGRCSRCHQLVKDSSSSSSSSSKVQRLFAALRNPLSNSSKRNVSAASVEGIGGVVAESVGGSAGAGSSSSAWTHASGKAIPAHAQKIVGYWLLGCAGACFAQVRFRGMIHLIMYLSICVTLIA